MNTRTSPSAPAPKGLPALVDATLAPERLVATAHGEDWPDPSAAGPLSPEVWRSFFSVLISSDSVLSCCRFGSNFC